jgi:hypothetical protein
VSSCLGAVATVHYNVAKSTCVISAAAMAEVKRMTHRNHGAAASGNTQEKVSNPLRAIVQGVCACRQNV